MRTGTNDKAVVQPVSLPSSRTETWGKLLGSPARLCARFLARVSWCPDLSHSPVFLIVDTKHCANYGWLPSMTKHSNFDDVLFSKPGRANQTWLVQKTLRGMKVASPSLIGSRCLPRLVTAWACWLQANLHIWVTLLAIRSWRPWMVPCCRHWDRHA